MPLRKSGAFPHAIVPTKPAAQPVVVPLPRRDGRRNRRPMTVCIAALCTWSATPPVLMIVGASDRLLTAGDIEFEPSQQKIYQFTPAIVALVAGDAHAQISICDATRARFALQAAGSVEEVANAYADELSKYRRKHAEYKYLKPLGLDIDNFLSSSMASSLAFDMTNFKLEIETIITGSDNTGYHIFIVHEPGTVRCADSIGFAAIGMGQRHAESTFMFQRYSRQWLFQRALLLTYAAKKRAEVAPGIGVTTDFFYIGFGGFQPIHTTIVDEIDATYKQLDATCREANEAAGERVDKSIPEIIARNAREQQTRQHAEQEQQTRQAQQDDGQTADGAPHPSDEAED